MRTIHLTPQPELISITLSGKFLLCRLTGRDEILPLCANLSPESEPPVRRACRFAQTRIILWS
jgi:hypothetical protein